MTVTNIFREPNPSEMHIYLAKRCMLEEEKKCISRTSIGGHDLEKKEKGDSCTVKHTKLTKVLLAKRDRYKDMTLSEIAADTGYSPSTISNNMKKLNLSFRRTDKKVIASMLRGNEEYVKTHTIKEIAVAFKLEYKAVWNYLNRKRR